MHTTLQKLDYDAKSEPSYLATICNPNCALETLIK